MSEIRRAPRGRSARLTTLLLALTAVGLTPALAWGEQPGYYPSHINKNVRPPQGGRPAPERHTWDNFANSCSGRPQPGTLDLKRYIDYYWPGNSWGIYNCRNIRGGTRLSIHAEGRALDWRLYAWRSGERAAAEDIVSFFLETDTHGQPRAMVRRFGIQHIIYNNYHWRASQLSQGWHYCACGHRDHLHIEQNWAGARRRTTAWTGYEPTLIALPRLPSAPRSPSPLGIAGSTEYVPHLHPPLD